MSGDGGCWIGDQCKPGRLRAFVAAGHVLGVMYSGSRSVAVKKSSLHSIYQVGIYYAVHVYNCLTFHRKMSGSRRASRL